MPKKARKQATKKPKIKDLKAVKSVKGGAMIAPTAAIGKWTDPLTASALKMQDPLSTTGMKVTLDKKSLGY